MTEEDVYREIDEAYRLIEENLAVMKLCRLNGDWPSGAWNLERREEKCLERALKHLEDAQADRLPF